MNFTCKACNKIFQDSPKRLRKFCSWSCRTKGVLKICLDCKKEYTVLLSKKYVSNYCSAQCKFKGLSKQRKGVLNSSLLKALELAHAARRGKPAWNKGKVRPEMSGSNHPNWQGGLTAKNKLVRKSIIYQLWRNAVFERDNYICQSCGSHGGDLNADHIKPFALYPKLRFSIDNGRTLCKSCHTKTSTWGHRSDKASMLLNWGNI